jgi:glycosyltransferase involved in cell wall biosynthesis
MTIYPYVSIILPVRNEERHIRRVLQSVTDQDYPDSCFEIIVVDGMSTDRTREILLGYQKKYPNILILDNPGKIVPTGLNKAFQVAKGDIIIRVDGHCIVEHDHVHKCVNYLKNNAVDGVGGKVITVGETPLSEAIAIAMSSRFGVGGSTFRTVNNNAVGVDTIPFPAYTRDIINRVGCYDEEMSCNEDDEYNYRIREHGGKLFLIADISSLYFCRSSLSALWKQFYRYGFWKVRVFQKHPRQMSLRQFVPPAFVLALLVAALLILFPATRFLSLIVPLVYLIANLGASLLMASKRNWRALALLPVIFAFLHFSYGLGFLIGLLKFSRRWGDKQSQTPAIGCH